MSRNNRNRRKQRDKHKSLFDIVKRIIIVFYASIFAVIFLLFILLIIFDDDTEESATDNKEIVEVSEDSGVEAADADSDHGDSQDSYDLDLKSASEADFKDISFYDADYKDGEYLDISAYETDNLDEILGYVINVKPDMSDGSLYITYNIHWLVLDSDEDEVTWVKIGIPNKYTEDIKALSKNIEDIQYISSSGDFVRIDFDDSYEEGQVINFSFSIHAHQLYYEKGSIRRYSFTPGWFDEIDVERIEVKWDVSDIEGDINHLCRDGEIVEDDGIVFFIGSLNAGEKFNTTIDIPDKAFDADDTYSEELKEDNTFENLFFGGFFIFLILVLVWPLLAYLIFYIKAFFWSVDAYQKGKMNTFAKESSVGDYMRRYRKEHMIEYMDIDKNVHSYYSSGGRHGHGGGGGCACACACACAGGGRAGCSTKDFYGTILTTEQIHKIHERSR